MSKLVIFLFGLTVLLAVSRFEPIKSWRNDFFSQKTTLYFLLPLFAILGWPIETLDTFKTGADLGGKRIALVMFFLSSFVLLSFYLVKRRYLHVPKSIQFRLFTLYCVMAAASTLYSLDPLQTAWKSFELFVILIFGIKLHLEYREQPARAVAHINSIVYIAFALCVFSLVGVILAPEMALSQFDEVGWGVKSMGGIAPSINPNTLGQLGAIVFLIGISRKIMDFNDPPIGNVIIVLTGVSALLIAYSRTSLIATFMIVLVLLLIMKKYLVIIFAVSAILLISTTSGDFFVEYLARGQTPEQFASLSGRAGTWDAAIAKWETSPWIGHGFFAGHKFVGITDSGFLATVDSSYIETLVNLGLVGFILLAAFAISMLFSTTRFVVKTHNNMQPIAFSGVVLWVFVTVIIFRSFTATSFQSLHYNLLFMVVAMSAISGLNCLQKENSQS